MNIVCCRRLMALFMYCGVAMLVIANGQPTTDDDIDINRLIDVVAELRAELAKVKGELATLSANKLSTRT